MREERYLVYNTMMLFRLSIALAAIVASFLYPGNALAYLDPCKALRVGCTTQCSDEIDNDGDGKIDYPNDPECADSADDDEASAPPSPESTPPPPGGGGGGGVVPPPAPPAPAPEPEVPVREWHPPTPRPRVAKPAIHAVAPAEPSMQMSLPKSGAGLMSLSLLLSLGTCAALYPLQKERRKRYHALQ